MESGGEGLKIRGKRSRWQGCEGQSGAPSTLHGDTLTPHCALGSAGSTHGACPQGKAGKAGLAVGLPTREEQSPGPQGAPVGGSPQ